MNINKGNIDFNNTTLEQLINSKRKFLYDYRIAGIPQSIPKYIGFDILLDCLKNYLEKKTFLTFNGVLDIAIRMASITNPKISISSSTFMGSCNGGLRLNANFEGFIEIKENNGNENELAPVTITLKKDCYLIKRDGIAQYIQNRITSLLDQFAPRANTHIPIWEIDRKNTSDIQYIKYTLGGHIDKNPYADSHAYMVDWATINKAIKNREPIGYKHLCYPSISNLPSMVTGKHFLWCEGKPCFRDNLHFPENWRLYKLPHFLQIWGQDDIVKQNLDDLITGNHEYNKLADVLTKAEKIIELMKCKNCGCLLFPIKKVNTTYANEYAYYCCENKQCSLYKQEVYLNHCYNCREGIIDSREVQKCPNGMFICPSCFSCCSNKYFEQMVKRYSFTSKYIPERLKRMLGTGHLEAGIRFCPKCGTEFNTNQEICPKCNNEIKIRRYKKHNID